MTRKSTKPPNAKTCKACKSKFTPARPLQVACSPICGLELARKSREAKEKKAAAVDKRETKEKLESMKGRGYWMAQAQAAFNLFIRTRDQLAGHACISSGRPLDWSGNAVDAGHFRSRGSAPHMRFVEANVHAQSKYENRYMSGNAPGYRVGLIARIGLEAVEALESDQNPRKYSIDDLKAIKADYTARVREMKNSL